MKSDKITVGILFGGKSAEHEVSLNSAKALYHNLDKSKYSPLLIYISREDGRWRRVDENRFQQKAGFTLPPNDGYSFLPWLNRESEPLAADIYFPMLHGPNGEDGKIQGLLELAGKPYVGANSVSSALAMDKVVSKILFQKAGLRVVDFLVFENHDYPRIRDAIAGQLSFPVFIKPSSMGSSVGISKVKEESQLKAGLDLAFRYDRKILVEKALEVREIEVSVMGNEEILVSRPGELIPGTEFYDYTDKYIDNKTTFHMPAQLVFPVEEEICQTVKTAYKALFLNGMSRVDLFIEKGSNKVYINEINTIPGFTEISMFPKLWNLQGISFTELITRLIDYGFDYFKKHRAATDPGKRAVE
jgi:D-alanine-D-alanine ligase